MNSFSGDLYSSLKNSLYQGDRASTDFLVLKICELCQNPQDLESRNAIFAAGKDREGLLVLFALAGPIGTGLFRLEDDTNKCIVHYVAENHSFASLNLIKERTRGIGCFKQTDSQGNTAVHWAARNKHDSSGFKWLVHVLGAECLTEQDADSNTPIHIAAHYQNADTMLFIKAKMNDSHCFQQLKGLNNMTAVHMAALNENSSSALEWLVEELGPNCLNDMVSKGETVLDLCRLHQPPKVMCRIRRI